MTPRQISARLFFISQRDLRDNHMQLGLHALASSGDGTAIKKQLDKWEREL